MDNNEPHDQKAKITTPKQEINKADTIGAMAMVTMCQGDGSLDTNRTQTEHKPNNKSSIHGNYH